jgi:hypothetical protein
MRRSSEIFATSLRTGSKADSTRPPRVVDDQVDTRGRLDGADVAALAPDDPPLHLVRREIDDDTVLSATKSPA